MILITLIFFLSYNGIQRYIKKIINGVMQEEVNSVVAITESCLDEDALQVLTDSDVRYDEALGWPDGMKDQRYWDQQQCLEDVDFYNPRAEVFTYYQVDSNTLAYGLDQWATLDPEKSYPFRETFKREDDEDFDKLMLGLQDTYYYDDLKYFEEDDVYYFGASAPLKNSAGKVIGGLTVYLDANVMIESLKDLSNSLYISFFVIYILVAALILAITRRATAQLSALKNASSRVAEGDYTPIMLKDPLIGDEVSTLAERFNLMLDKVRGTVEDLQNQVVELNFQIDKEKKNKEVKEIVETEFFQDLKSRAAAIRKERQEKE
jgi:methyl-accepting chemotaxis protein